MKGALEAVVWVCRSWRLTWLYAETCLLALLPGSYGSFSAHTYAFHLPV